MFPQAKNHVLLRLALTAAPVSLAGAMAWFGVFTFVNAYLVQGLQQTNAEWTVATLWFMGGTLFWQFLCTEISAKLGRREALTLSLSISVLAFLGIALTTSLTVIHLLLALIGIVTAMNSIVWQPMVAAIGGERPGQALAIGQFVAVVVGASGLIAGGQIIDRFGYRGTFLIVAAVCALCTVAFWFLSKSFARQVAGEVVSLRHIHVSDLRRLAVGPFLIIVLLGPFMEPYNYHTINQLFPNLARDLHHLHTAQYSTIVALGRLPSLLSLALLAHFIDRLKARRVYGICLAAAGCCVAIIGQVGGTLPLVLGYFGFYLCHGMVWGSNSAAINASLEPRLRDSGFALMSIVAYLAIFITGFIHNRLLSAGFSLPQVFLTCGLIAVTAGAALFLYSFTAHSEAPPAEKPVRELAQVVES